MGTCKERCFIDSKQFNKTIGACCKENSDCESKNCWSGLCVSKLVFGYMKFPYKTFYKGVAFIAGSFVFTIFSIIIGFGCYIKNKINKLNERIKKDLFEEKKLAEKMAQT